MASSPSGSKPVSKKQQHRKPKPWDTPDVEHWKIDPWTEADAAKTAPFTEESSFATLFPKYREAYLQAQWPDVKNTLKQYGLAAELDLVEGSMTVRTTRKTRDPFIVLKARDMIKLLARSVPVPQARRVLQDDVVCDIIKIGGITRSKPRFVKRRARLIGPNGHTLKALELLTQCYIVVQGNTVAALGTYKGLKVVRRVVEDAMRNIHPIYNIKQLMIRRELAKDEKLVEENWDRFLPKFKKPAKRPKRRAPAEPKKAYTPFPPQQLPRKEDIQMETGEYFLSEQARKSRKRTVEVAERDEKSRVAKAARVAKREEAFVEPVRVAPAPAPAASRTNDDTRDAASIAQSILQKQSAPRTAFHLPSGTPPAPPQLQNPKGERKKGKSKKKKKKKFKKSF